MFAEYIVNRESDLMKHRIKRNFRNGFMRALDISGVKEWPDISDGNRKDYFSLRSDWENVGNAIQRACSNYRGTGR